MSQKMSHLSASLWMFKTRRYEPMQINIFGKVTCRSVKEIADVCSKEHGSGKGSIFRNTMIPKVKVSGGTLPCYEYRW